MYPINLSLSYIGEIISLVFIAIIALVGTFYGLMAFYGMMKLDDVFFGQFIKDIESLTNWITKRTKKDE